MSENLFPRNNNYEELQKLNDSISTVVKNMQLQQRYIESIPDNVYQSVSESCSKSVMPGINEFTHDEITSMYYHIQTSMSDEYKKQGKKIEQIMNDKFEKNSQLMQKSMEDIFMEFIKNQEETKAKTEKRLLINTILSGAAAVLALICIILTVLL